MDDATPEPLPEAALIRRARMAKGMSISELSRRTRRTLQRGASQERVSTIEDSYERRAGRGGSINLVRASPPVLAHIARVLGITPEHLEAAAAEYDAPDAQARFAAPGEEKARVLQGAEILRDLRAAEPAAPAVRPLPTGADLSRLAANWPGFAGIFDRMNELAGRPSGADLFPDPADFLDAATWDRAAGWPPAERALIVADLRRSGAERDPAADPAGQRAG